MNNNKANQSRNELGLPPIEQAFKNGNKRRQPYQSKHSVILGDYVKTVRLLRLLIITGIVQLACVVWLVSQLFSK